MAVSITHTKVSEKIDGADETLVRPSDWNAVHTFADIAPLASPTFTGQVIVPNGLEATPGVVFTSETNSGFYWKQAGRIALSLTGSFHYYFTDVEFDILGNDIPLKLGAASDVVIRRGAANVLDLRNTTNAQSLRIYTSYTDASNYERFAINTAAGTITLAAETLGTGTDNINISLVPAGTGQVLFPNGAAATPSIAFASDTDTGIMWGTSGIIQFVNNSAVRYDFRDDVFSFMGTAVAGLYPVMHWSNASDLKLVYGGTACLQLGWNAAGVTDQMIKGPDRITSDGVGGNFTIAGGRNRGASVGGSIIFQTSPAAAAGVTGTLTTRLTIDSTGILNIASGGTLQVGGTQVVGARVVDARCDDAINSGDATTDGVIDALRDAMITHGLIAAA